MTTTNAEITTKYQKKKRKGAYSRQSRYIYWIYGNRRNFSICFS